MNVISHICLVLGLFVLAGCTSPHQTTGAPRCKIDSVLLTGEWGELDTGAAFTFAANGSFQYTYNTDVPMTVTGSYTVLSPGVVVAIFSPTAMFYNQRPVKYYYYKAKDQKRLITTEGSLVDSWRKAKW